MEKIRLILADDHVLVREGFKSLLNKNDSFEIAGEASNGVELLKMITEKNPDIVLLDISMPGLTGIEVMNRYLNDNKSTTVRFIVLSMHEEREYILRALQAGAQGYLLKNSEKSELEKAIHTVYNGDKYISPAIGNILATAAMGQTPKDKAELTNRELEVLQLVADGHSTKQIADKLAISIRTVESHRINMLKKMEVNNTAELVKKSIQLLLIHTNTHR